MNYTDFLMFLNDMFVINATNEDVFYDKEIPLNYATEFDLNTHTFIPRLNGTVNIQVRVHVPTGATRSATVEIYKDNETTPIVTKSNTDTESIDVNINLPVLTAHKYKIRAFGSSRYEFSSVRTTIAGKLAFRDVLINEVI